jgi:hypothetical protein
MARCTLEHPTLLDELERDFQPELRGLIPTYPAAARSNMLLPRRGVTVDDLDWVHFSEFDCWVAIPPGSALFAQPVMVTPHVPDGGPKRNKANPVSPSDELLQAVQFHFGQAFVMQQNSAPVAGPRVEGYQDALRQSGGTSAESDFDVSWAHAG